MEHTRKDVVQFFNRMKRVKLKVLIQNASTSDRLNNLPDYLTVSHHKIPSTCGTLGLIKQARKKPRLMDSNLNSLMGLNQRSPSPLPFGMLPSPAPGIRPPFRYVSGAWDVFDAKQFQKEAKRSRIRGSVPNDDDYLLLRKMDDWVLGMDQLYGLGIQFDGGCPSLHAM
ncbi:hypothetical protein L1049_002784 [Liquidambar formosana]|uniref:Uncharacterized protein n=1 Tax=Liquidambar formosana TaxID=63359 RepID=A0AAP0R700_LIQFO